jgi:ubiquinone biosynthesis protein UbiJ
MMDAKYGKVDPVKIAKSQTHLSSSQHNDLINLLSKYDTLFDGTLGKYPHRKPHLALQERATPVLHSKNNDGILGANPLETRGSSFESTRGI